MGVDLRTFDALLNEFRTRLHCEDSVSMSKKGHPALLDTESILALILHYLSSRSEQNVIGRLFRRRRPICGMGRP